MAKQGMKLLGLFLMVSLIAAAGCRKKAKPNGGTDGEIYSPEPITTGTEVDLESRPGANEFGTPVQHSLEPVMFKFDSAQMDSSEMAKGDKVAAFLNDNPSYKVVIEGNCDERGTAEYNMALGERRAQAVKAYLLNIGVPEDKIHTLSYGEEKAADPGHAEAAWSKNRRADFAIYE